MAVARPVRRRVHDLGRRVLRRPRDDAQDLARRQRAGQPKVADLEHVLVRVARRLQIKNVLRLEVAVHDVERVAVRDGVEELRRRDARVALRQPPRRHDAIEEVAAAAEVQDHGELRAAEVAVVDVEHVRVAPQPAHGLDLGHEPRGHAGVVAAQVDDLDGALGAVLLRGPRGEDLGELAVAEERAERVVRVRRRQRDAAQLLERRDEPRVARRHERVEGRRVDAEARDGADGAHGRGPRRVVEQRELAEVA